MKENIKIILLFITDMIITSLTTVWMWNTIVSGILGAKMITIPQGWAIAIAITYFFKKITYECENIKERLERDIGATITIWILGFIVCIFC